MNNIGSSVGSAYTIAANTINQGNAQAQQAAQEVAVASFTERPVEGAGEISKPITDLKEAEHLVSAGGKVMQAADEQVGTLLDIKA